MGPLQTDLHAHSQKLSRIPCETIEPDRLALGAYETPIDKMLSMPPQRATLELVPDRAQSLVLTDYRAPSEGT